MTPSMEEETELNHHKKKLTSSSSSTMTLIMHKQGSSLRRNPPPTSNNTSIINQCDNNNNNKKKSFHHQEGVKLAGLAISFNVRLRSADMPAAMQERALRHARALLDSAADRRRPNPTLLARSLKKEFDSVYGPAWHCIAGKSFGSFVTHSPGGFVYFSVDSLSFLLFKTQVHVIAQPSPKS